MRVGVDIGSVATKLVVVKEKEIVELKEVPTDPFMRRSFSAVLKEIEGLDVQRINVTGYGRNVVKEDATKVVNELWANAYGAYILSKGKVKTLINIGGQDIKIIYVAEKGRVEDFIMNDKCAAGTGRFIENMARVLQVEIDQLEEMARKSKINVNLTNTCSVFAETEMVSLAAQGVSTEDLAMAVFASVVRRIKTLLKGNIKPPVYLDGGPAKISLLKELLSKQLGVKVNTLPNPQYTTAYGCALMN